MRGLMTFELAGFATGDRQGRELDVAARAADPCRAMRGE